MDKPSFVYVTYIATSPEKVWQALTDADMSELWWTGNRAVSDWKVGSPWELKRQTLVVTGTVLESDPPRRLSFTFHSQHDGLDREAPSRVTFEIERQKDQVKLTVTHDEFPAGSEVFPHINRGWPLVISSLKSVIETGRGLRAPWYEDAESSAA